MKNLPDPAFYKQYGKDWHEWAKALTQKLTKEEPVKAPQLQIYAVADLPSAEAKFVLIGVINETGGPTIAFSDGTNWRRVQDLAIVS